MRLAIVVGNGVRIGTAGADSAHAFIVARNQLADALALMDHCTATVREPSPDEWQTILNAANFAVKLAKYRKAPPPGSRVCPRDASET